MRNMKDAQLIKKTLLVDQFKKVVQETLESCTRILSKKLK